VDSNNTCPVGVVGKCGGPPPLPAREAVELIASIKQFVSRGVSYNSMHMHAYLTSQHLTSQLELGSVGTYMQPPAHVGHTPLKILFAPRSDITAICRTVVIQQALIGGGLLLLILLLADQSCSKPPPISADTMTTVLQIAVCCA
jgi:hypothetical protein